MAAADILSFPGTSLLFLFLLDSKGGLNAAAQTHQHKGFLEDAFQDHVRKFLRIDSALGENPGLNPENPGL